MSLNTSEQLAPVTFDLTKNPPAPHKSGMAWEFQETYKGWRKRVGACLTFTAGIDPYGKLLICGGNGFLTHLPPILDKDIHMWSNLVEIACGGRIICGRKADGTIIHDGFWATNNEEQIKLAENRFKDIGGIDPKEWPNNIVALSCSHSMHVHFAGLTSDGCVVAYGYNTHSQCETSEWCDICEVIVQEGVTVGVRKDGTVVYCGGDDHMKIIESWTNIEHVYANYKGIHYENDRVDIIGLKYDGTVVSTFDSDLSSWENIIHISCGGTVIAGLTGTGKTYFLNQSAPHLTFPTWEKVYNIDICVPQMAIATIYPPNNIGGAALAIYNMDTGVSNMGSDILAFSTFGYRTIITVKADSGMVGVNVLDDNCNFGQDDTADWIIKPLDAPNVDNIIEYSPTTKQSSNTMQNSNKKHNSGCYIATCVYGSYDCPEVWTLRRFRDEVLAATWYGKLFIKAYYAVSPTLVKIFGNTEWFKSLWSKVLNPMVSKLNINGVEDTEYEDKNIF